MWILVRSGSVHPAYEESEGTENSLQNFLENNTRNNSEGEYLMMCLTEISPTFKAEGGYSPEIEKNLKRKQKPRQLSRMFC